MSKYTVEKFEKMYAEWRDMYDDAMSKYSLYLDDAYTKCDAECDAWETTDNYFMVTLCVDPDVRWFLSETYSCDGNYFAMDDMVYLRNGYSLDLCTGYVYDESDAA